MARSTRIIVGLIGVTSVVMLAVHLPLLLGRGARSGGGACPFGYGPAEAATGPLIHNATLRGAATAKERPALAFTLGATTRTDIEDYVARRGSPACTEKRGELECANVIVEQGPALADAWFRFDRGGRLDSIRTVRRSETVGPISSTFADLEHHLTTTAGAPTSSTGSIDPLELSRGLLRQASTEYRFTNYRAVLRATNMGGDYVLTEEYDNLVD